MELTSILGDSLPLIFCIHVRSGPIYWGVIYLAGTFVIETIFLNNHLSRQKIAHNKLKQGSTMLYKSSSRNLQASVTSLTILSPILYIRLHVRDHSNC
jgi:hypothetical protein